MAGIIPGPLIQGPEPIGRRYGLFTAASGPIDLPEHGRGGGVRYVEQTCAEAHPYPIDCSAGEVEDPTKVGDPDNPTFEADPFVVYASIECGSVGYTPTEFMDKVSRRLAMGAQEAVERALWDGMGDTGSGLVSLDITNLVDSATLITPAIDSTLPEVLSALEDWIYRVQKYPNVAFIHAPWSMAAIAARDYLIVERSGSSLKYTPGGSIWVFGGGYTGTGPGDVAPPAGGAYLYVTGQTTVWAAAEPFVWPAPQILNRETNQYFLLAEQEYAVGFDCAAGAALYNPLGGS